MIVFRRAVYWMSKKTRPPATPKMREKTKSKALSDDKAGKIAKSDEEAQIKMEQ